MRWPRGKHNGQRIEGFELKFKVHLTWWNWKPLAMWNFGEPAIFWLCFTWRAYVAYAMLERSRRLEVM